MSTSNNVVGSVMEQNDVHHQEYALTIDTLTTIYLYIKKMCSIIT